MVSSSNCSTIVVIGNDPMLGYLLKRYAEQSGCRMVTLESIPVVDEIAALDPSVLIFASIEHLQNGQELVGSHSLVEIPVMVCASVTDEAVARELGVDTCLLHPLTYDRFQEALSSY